MVHAVDSLEREIERRLADYRMNGGKRRLVDRLGDGKKGGWNRETGLQRIEEKGRHSVPQSLKFHAMDLIEANA